MALGTTLAPITAGCGGGNAEADGDARGVDGDVRSESDRADEADSGEGGLDAEVGDSDDETGDEDGGCPPRLPDIGLSLDVTGTTTRGTGRDVTCNVAEVTETDADHVVLLLDCPDADPPVSYTIDIIASPRPDLLFLRGRQVRFDHFVMTGWGSEYYLRLRDPAGDLLLAATNGSWLTNGTPEDEWFSPLTVRAAWGACLVEDGICGREARQVIEVTDGPSTASVLDGYYAAVGVGGRVDVLVETALVLFVSGCTDTPGAWYRVLIVVH